MNDHGTVFLMTDLTSQQLHKGKHDSELGFTLNDILLNPVVYKNESNPRLLELSLKSFLKYLYIEYVEGVRVCINSINLDSIDKSQQGQLSASIQEEQSKL